jgi:hypothetical protein
MARMVRRMSSREGQAQETSRGRTWLKVASAYASPRDTRATSNQQGGVSIAALFGQG